MSAGIDVEQRLIQRNVAEGADKLQLHWFVVHCDWDVLAALVAELQEIIAVSVGDEIAKGSVGGNDFSGEAPIVESRGFELQAYQSVHHQFGTDLVPVFAARAVAPHRGEDVAAVECRGEFAADHPLGIGYFVGSLNAVPLFDEREQTVVGKNKILAAPGLGDDCLARAADGRINHDYEDGSGGIVGRSAVKEPRAIENRKRRDLMGEVDDADLGHDGVHDSPADGNGVVEDAEIGHEDDGGRIFLRGWGGSECEGAQACEQKQSQHWDDKPSLAGRWRHHSVQFSGGAVRVRKKARVY